MESGGTHRGQGWAVVRSLFKSRMDPPLTPQRCDQQHSSLFRPAKTKTNKKKTTAVVDVGSMLLVNPTKFDAVASETNRHKSVWRAADVTCASVQSAMALIYGLWRLYVKAFNRSSDRISEQHFSWMCSFSHCNVAVRVGLLASRVDSTLVEIVKLHATTIQQLHKNLEGVGGKEGK